MITIVVVDLGTHFLFAKTFVPFHLKRFAALTWLRTTPLAVRRISTTSGMSICKVKCELLFLTKDLAQRLSSLRQALNELSMVLDALPTVGLVLEIRSTQFPCPPEGEADIVALSFCIQSVL